MASILRMPGISADAEEAVLLEWSLSEGSEFHPGDLLATVETEKANVDIESDQDAVLWRTLAEPGASVAVGAPIAVLLSVGENIIDVASVFTSLGLSVPDDAGVEPTGLIASTALPETVEEAFGSEPTPAPSSLVGAASTATDLADSLPRREGRVFASPLARRIARENNIDVAQIEGTGSGDRIVRVDVERAIAAAMSRTVDDTPALGRPAPAVDGVEGAVVQALDEGPEAKGTTYTDVPHTAMRRAVARFLTQSKREAPHFYLNATCRVDALLALREKINADAAARVSINDFVVKAVAKALEEVPEMNAIWMNDAVRRYDSIDISVAISSAKGLVTPVIRSAEGLSLSQISRQVRDFAVRANDGRLKQNELEGGSFTVTNLGMFGVESFSAIINPPQVGILAVGAVVQQAIVVNGIVEVGSTLTVTVSVDHRPVDGVLAAQWLQRFKSLIENPLAMLV